MISLFFLIVIIIIASQTFAQDDKSYDVVLKLNGEEHIGHVIEMNDVSIKFVHKNETLSYEFKKSDIMKITFASGRIEIINNDSSNNEGDSIAGSGLESHHNKIAILPFRYLIEKQSAGDEISYKVQEECYTFLSKHVGELSIVDPMTTNAMLIKAGINQENIRAYTMGEICNILGVEYLITGTITQNRTSTSSYQGGVSNTKVKGDKNNFVSNLFSSSSSYSSSYQNYQTSMTMNVFTDKNTTIYSKEHASFWQSTDAYKITLQYMLKHTPIYKK